MDRRCEPRGLQSPVRVDVGRRAVRPGCRCPGSASRDPEVPRVALPGWTLRSDQELALRHCRWIRVGLWPGGKPLVLRSGRPSARSPGRSLDPDRRPGVEGRSTRPKPGLSHSPGGSGRPGRSPPFLILRRLPCGLRERSSTCPEPTRTRGLTDGFRQTSGSGVSSTTRRCLIHKSSPKSTGSPQLCTQASHGRTRTDPARWTFERDTRRPQGPWSNVADRATMSLHNGSASSR